MSQNSAGSSQPGKRQVRSRTRTKSSSAADGRYPGSGASPGRRTSLTLAPERIRSASNGVGTILSRSSRPEGGLPRRISLDMCGSGCAWSADDSVTTWMTTFDARPSLSSDWQSGLPQVHASRSAPAARAPMASARRWAIVRGSSSHTPCAISTGGDPAPPHRWRRACPTPTSCRTCRPSTRPRGTGCRL